MTLQAFFPLSAVRGEYRVGSSVVFDYFICFENDDILVTAEGNAASGKDRSYLLVPATPVRFIITVSKYGLCRKCLKNFFRFALQNQEA